MKFSIVVIARDEAKNIGKLAESAKKYLDAGGQIFLFDTGSQDDTPNIARKLGFQVVESKENFQKTLSKNILTQWLKKYHIRKRFVDSPTSFFCFDEARNAAAKISDQNIIFFMDGCDHFINFDFEKINNLITKGYDQFDVVQSYGGISGQIKRFYDRTKGYWTGHIHESLEITSDNCYDIPKDVLLIKHEIITKNRTKYLAGLIYSHYINPDSRNDYYLGRELYLSKIYNEARIFLHRRFQSGKFPEERAAAMCFIAKSYIEESPAEKSETEKKELDEKVHKCYEEALKIGSKLKQVYFELCEYYFKNENWDKVLYLATECLKLVKAEDHTFFEEERFTNPDNLSWYLYHGHYWAGQKDMAVYYWRNFTKSRGIQEENHEYWKFLAPYTYFPSIPLEIAEIKFQDGNKIEYYKTLSNIEEKDRIIPKEEMFMINFLKSYVPPCTNSIDIFPGKGMISINLSKMLYPGVVHSFEPRREEFRKLTSNSYINGRDNLKTYENLIGQFHGQFVNREHPEFNDYILTQNINNTFFGAEDLSLILISSHIDLNKSLTSYSDVIKGSTEVINKHKPILCIFKPHVDETVKVDSLISHIDYKKIQLTDVLFYLPKSIYSSKKIAIACYDASNIKWDSKSLNNHFINIGEAEQAVINLANSLVEKGYSVDVWGSPNCISKWNSGCTSLRYLDYKYLHGFLDSSEYYNAVIWWRNAKELNIKSKKTRNILWVHDYSPPKINLEMIDNIVFLSEIHKAGIIECYDISVRDSIEKISVVIPTGVFVNETKKSECFRTRIKYRCVYLNNHAYGLEILLDAWYKIKEKIPSATLHIFHNSETWGIKSKDEEQKLLQKINSMRVKGVSLQNSNNQTNLHSEFKKSEFWLYPCIYEEPYCIQGVQAVKDGVIPIVSDQKFLRMLTDPNCMIWPLEPDSFANKCVEIMLMDEGSIDKIRTDNLKRIETQDLFYTSSRTAEKFSELFELID